MKKLDFLNRDQISIIHRLGKKQNTNRILRELAPFLSSYRENDSPNIYFLNKLGREYVNSQKERKKNKFVNHVLMRNDFYIFSGFPHEWKNEIKFSDNDYSLICDALFKTNGKYQILEVDSLKKMNMNRSKISVYKWLFRNGKIHEHFGFFPKLTWLTSTDHRKKQLIDLCRGLPYAVYTIKDIR
ncbi:replication-relaxation family protein [Acinetobacter baumannii]